MSFLTKTKEKTGGLAYFNGTQGGEMDVFSSLSSAITKPNTKTANTQMRAPLAPGEIGAAINPELLQDAKEIVGQVGNHFPMRGLEPEKKAQLNLLAGKLMPKAAADARFYTEKAGQIMESAADLHTSQVKHKANAFRADLQMKKADVDHLGAVQGWQEKTLSLVEQARYAHAGIQLAANCL